MVVIPLLLKIWNLRKVASKKHLEDAWQDLRALDDQVATLRSKAEAEALLERLRELGERVSGTWLSRGEIRFLYAVRNAIRQVRDAALARMKEFS